MGTSRRQARERAAKKTQSDKQKAIRAEEKIRAARKKANRTGAASLSAKQARFVEEYPIDLNATQAAIRAGYSPRTAQSQGPRLLDHVVVAAALSDALKARSARTQITADQVLEELAKLAFSNMEDFAKVDGNGGAALDLSNIDRDQFAAVSELTTDTIGGLTTRTKVKLSCKRASLELLGKNLGMFNKLVLSGDPDSPIVTQVTRRIIRAAEN